MASFSPLALPRTRTYPGYQFTASFRMDGVSTEKCMHYIILTVLTWVKNKLSPEDIVPELDMPENRDYAKVTSDSFHSCHIRQGYTLDITSLMNLGIWTLHISEPDMDREDRSAVAGRSFVTDVGIKKEADGVYMGIRIHVVDPAEMKTEVAYAYRPAFLRDLFNTSKLRIKQVDLLYYEKPFSVGNSHSLRRMLDILKSQDNFMPCVILTYAMERRKVLELADQLDESMGLSGTEASFRAQLMTMTLIPDMLEYGMPVLPYDADLLARHAFGYGRVFVVEAAEFENFEKHFSTPVQKGDMLLVSPARFGGDVQVFSCREGSPSEVRENHEKKVLSLLHSYSKNCSYDFGTVVFESAARRRETEERIREVLSSQAESDREKTEQVYRDTEQLLDLYDEENRELKQEVERLKEENQNLNGRVLYYDARLNSVNRAAGPLKFPETEEFFQDEQHDLVVSILQEARKTYAHEDSRAMELLDGILKENELTGIGKEILEEIKAVLYRDKNVTNSDLADLRRLGFDVSKRTNGHYKLIFHNNPKYTFTLSGTSSDSRSMKNSYAEMENKLSVYH